MLWWIAQNIAVTLALAALVWIACRFFGIGPVGRHALWLVVLLKMLTPPLVAWPWAVGEPAWTSVSTTAPVPPGGLPASAAPATPAAIPADAYESASLDTPLNPPIVIVLPAEATAPHQALLPVAITPAVPAVSSDVPPSPAKTTVDLPPPVAVRMLQSLAALWLTGSIVFFGLEFLRARRMVRLVRRSDPASEALVNCVAHCSRQLGIRPVRVVQVAELTSPAIWCIGKPVLLWPARLPATIARESVKGLVLHELAHVRRRDHWVGWLELLVGGVWWWNPLFWYVRHQVRENAELACDGWVVEALPDGRRAYAEGLLSVCEFMSRRSAPMPAVGVNTGGRKFLERRLAMIMKERIGLRLPRLGLVTIALLAMTALPAWSRKPDTTLRLADPAAESPKANESHGDRDGGYLHGALHRYTVAQSGLEMQSREQALRQELIATLQQLKAQAVAAGRSDEAAAIEVRIFALQAETSVGLTVYRDRVGQTIRLPAVGQSGGSVWGGSDNIYTDDSDLGTAAVHAGLLKPGQQGTVEVEILPGQQSYTGLTRNGITSSSYLDWPGSYRILRLVGDGKSISPIITYPYATVRPRRVQPADPLAGARGQVGGGKLVLVLVEVVGATSGSVWGDGVYTDDSSIAAAAVHAGLIKPNQRATVVVQVLPGRDSYVGSARNGVISNSYNAWGGSFQLLGTVEKGTGLSPSDAAPTLDSIELRSSDATSQANPKVDPYAMAPTVGPVSATVLGPQVTDLSSTTTDIVRTVIQPSGNPGTLTAFRGKTGQSFVFTVTGAPSGFIWGDGVYTDDSELATVAVHAGLLKVGETGLLKVTLKPGQDVYAGSERNGVVSQSYSSWEGSYCVEKAVENAPFTPAPR